MSTRLAWPLFLFCTVVTAVFLSFAFTASAQTIPGIGNPIIFETIPTAPQPNSEVTVRAKSFSLDLNRATLSWSVDGRQLARGTGVTEVTFTLGNIGSASTVFLSATEAGETYTKQLTIRPAAVDILWQANTYTPPFYKGKALASSRAGTRFVAIPNIMVSGRRIPPSELIYTWTGGGQTFGNQSGFGRNSITLAAPRLTSNGTVGVTVETIDGSVETMGFISLQSVSPHVVVYENDPVLGMRIERAVSDSFDLVREEVMFTAHPYFISGSTRTNSGRNEFAWRVNNRVVENPLEDKSSIVLRQTGGSGTANVSVSVQNLDELLQRAVTGFSINFGDSNRSFFNL